MKQAPLRQRYKTFLFRRIVQRPLPPSTRPALVFAPHQDDETLGCGGTVYLKRQAGTSVCVVYLTDGGKSHMRFKSPAEMSVIRRGEAYTACQTLGLPEEQVLFLEFPNGALKDHRVEAGQKIEALLQISKAEEIFIPCALDFHDEHRITWEVVMGALHRLRETGRLTHAVQILEYPVWYWYHWPWVPIPARPAQDRTLLIRRLISTVFGLQSLKMFNQVVDIHMCQAVKQKALYAHASQMTRLNQNPKWRTLFDVANGEFAERFQQDYEIFKTGQLFTPVLHD